MTAVARPLSVGYRRDKKGGRSTNDGWSITITILEELERRGQLERAARHPTRAVTPLAISFL